MDGMDRVRAVLEAGVRGTRSEGKVDLYYRHLEGFVTLVERSMKPDHRMRVVGFSLDTDTGDPANDVHVAYGKRHTDGWFPFPHTHWHLWMCRDGTISEGDEEGPNPDGEEPDLHTCMHFEFPKDIDWPWPL